MDSSQTHQTHYTGRIVVIGYHQEKLVICYDNNILVMEEIIGKAMIFLHMKFGLR
jgi:hypothetical protein